MPRYYHRFLISFSTWPIKSSDVKIYSSLMCAYSHSFNTYRSINKMYVIEPTLRYQHQRTTLVGLVSDICGWTHLCWFPRSRGSYPTSTGNSADLSHSVASRNLSASVSSLLLRLVRLQDELTVITYTRMLKILFWSFLLLAMDGARRARLFSFCWKITFGCAYFDANLTSKTYTFVWPLPGQYIR